MLSNDMPGRMVRSLMQRPESRSLSHAPNPSRPVLVAVLGVMPAIPIFMGSEQLIQSAWLCYLVTLIIVNALFWQTQDHAKTFFSPSAVMVNSTLIWFLMGAVGLKFGLVGGSGYGLSAYYSLEHLATATSFFLGAVFVSVLALLLVYDRHIRLTSRRHLRIEKSLPIVATGVLITFTIAPLSLSRLGGTGDFSSVMQALGAVAIAVYVQKTNRSNWRFSIYATLCVYLAVSNVEDKRILVFFVIVLVFLEAHAFTRFRLTTRSIVLGLAAVSIVATSVITLSIQRGHGELRTANVGESLLAIPRYFQSPSSMDTLFINFEWTLSYFHSVNAVEKTIQNPDGPLMGATYVKALLVPVPRSIAPFKPDNFIGIYTAQVDSVYRSRGGSWPPNAYAEAFGNFHYAGGLAALFVIFSLLNRAFNSLLLLMRTSNRSITVLYLTMYLFLFEYFRGFGLDGFTATCFVLVLGYIGILAGQRLMSIETSSRGGQGGIRMGRPSGEESRESNRGRGYLDG